MTVKEKFEESSYKHDGGIAVSLYSAHDIGKHDFARACISKGIRKAYVAVNIPLLLLDDRMKQWDDPVLGVRYLVVDGNISMTSLNTPVAGYFNNYEKTMSWCRPHEPIAGHHVTAEVIAHVSSSYLIEVNIGRGVQEAFDMVWKMPDAGYYVLPKLTREMEQPEYYATSAQKFDQVVKFLLQLGNGKQLLENSAGRILGLEAAVKLGGVTLERSWVLDHQEFISTAIHAILAMGIGKTDGMNMMETLKSIYAEGDMKLSWSRGYSKLFGWYKDSRLPTQVKRGRNDYQPVTHWTMRQRAGWATIAKDMPPLACKRPGDEDVDDRPPKQEKDEGYESGEKIILDDVSEGSSEPDATVEGFSLFGKMFKRKEEGDKEKVDWAKVMRPGTSKVLSLSEEDRNGLRTYSRFEPVREAYPLVADETDSLAQQAFAAICPDLETLKVKLSEEEIPAPDRGVCTVIGVALETPIRIRDVTDTSLHQPPKLTDEERSKPMGKLQQSFINDIPISDEVMLPSLLYDGIAGAAKTSALVEYLRNTSMRALIICPTNKLARDWRKKNVGLTLTRHKPTKANFRRELYVIDEIFCYTKWEIAAYLKHAAVNKSKVIFLGDRQQQYTDGEELTMTDLRRLAAPTIRGCVTNTQPLDALKICRMVAAGDRMANLFQTRSQVDRSLFFEDNGGSSSEQVAAFIADRPEGKLDFSDILIMKDRSEIPLGYHRSDQEYGLAVDKLDVMTIARSQGLRVKNTMVLLSKTVRTEKWLSEQPGLFYVAVSRHSELCVVDCSVTELELYLGLDFESWVVVDGIANKKSTDEHHGRPMKVLKSLSIDHSEVMIKLMERGAVTQTGDLWLLGPLLKIGVRGNLARPLLLSLRRKCSRTQPTSSIVEQRLTHILVLLDCLFSRRPWVCIRCVAPFR